MIETVLLVALGFLSASLIVFLVAPAFWSRAVRLTTQRLRNSMPLTETEIRADKDLMRAEFAVRVHQLEKQIEQAKLNEHRRMIVISRREQRIAHLESLVTDLGGNLDETQNARRVLEQTINDRLPKFERRLDDARRLLQSRDREIQSLGQSNDRAEVALDEAQGIIAQQRAEIDRLKSHLAEQQSRDRRRLSDQGAQAEYALRTELETLRARSQEQALLIEQLNSGRSPAPDVLPAVPLVLDDSGLEVELTELTASSETGAKIAVLVRRQHEQLAQLNNELALYRDQIAPDGIVSVRDSKSFLKARVEKLQKEVETERREASRLRAELAASHERAARQAASFMEEMRHFGVRSMAPASRGARGSAPAPTVQRKSAGAPAPVLVSPAADPAPVVGRIGELKQAFRSRFGLRPGIVAAAALPPNGVSIAVEPPKADDATEADAPIESAELSLEEAPSSSPEAKGSQHRLLERLKSYESG